MRNKIFIIKLFKINPKNNLEIKYKLEIDGCNYQRNPERGWSRSQKTLPRKHPPRYELYGPLPSPRTYLRIKQI